MSGRVAQIDRSYEILVSVLNTPYSQIPMFQSNQRRGLTQIGFSEAEIRELERVWFTSRTFVTDQNEKYFGTSDNRVSQLNNMLNMGYSEKEARKVINVLYQCSKCTGAVLQKYYGYNAAQAKRIEYMSKIYTGKTQVETNDQLIKHFKTMTNNAHKLTVSDLATSKITTVPRFAVIQHITHEPYTIWNSNNYKGMQRLYRVYDVRGKSIIIETKRYPRLEFGAKKEIPGVLKILGKTAEGTVRVSFDEKYCKLTNRFMIVASTKNPEKHFGKYTILTADGNRVYVYAADMGTRETPKYQMGSQRIYDFGIFGKQIPSKLQSVASDLYKSVNGYSAQLSKPTAEYHTLSRSGSIEDMADDAVVI